MRRALFGLLLLLASAIAVTELADWSFLKPIIEEEVRSATGRSLDIQGALSLSLIPGPRISIADLSFANPAWASSQKMIEIRRLVVRPSVVGLLSGRLAMNEIRIERPEIHLETRAEGPVTANWELRPGTDSTSETGGEEDSVPRLLPGELTVSDATIRYLAAEMDEPLVLQLAGLRLAEDGEGLQATAEGRVDGRQFRAEVSAEPLAALYAQETYRGTVFIAARQLHVESQFTRNGSEWSLHGLAAEIAGSSVTGRATLHAAADPLRFTGALAIGQVGIGAIRDVLPSSPQSGDGGWSVPRLPDLAGSLDLSIDRLSLEKRIRLDDVAAQVELAPRTIELAAFEAGLGGGQVDGSATLTSAAEMVAAQGALALREVDLASTFAYDRSLGSLNTELALSLEPVDRTQLESAGDVALRHLRVERARLEYRSEAHEIRMQGALELAGAPAVPVLELQGSVRDRPASVELRGDPLPVLAADGMGYAVHLAARSRGLEAVMDTNLRSVLAMERFAADVEVTGTRGVDLTGSLGSGWGPLPAFRLAASVDRDANRWSAAPLEAKLGDSTAAGTVSFTNAPRPRIDADLDSERLDLSEILALAGRIAGPEEEAAANSAVSVLAPLRSVDGDVTVNAERVIVRDGLEVRGLVMQGKIESGAATVDPLRFQIGEGSVRSTVALDATAAPASGRLDIQVESVGLGRLGDTFTPLEEKLGTMSGEVHVTVSETRPADLPDDVRLPMIGRMAMAPSRLRFVDPEADTDLTLRMQTRSPADGDQVFQVNGDGRYGGDPFSVTFQGDRLLDARDPDRLYAVDLDLEAVDSHMLLHGTVLRPFALQETHLQLALEGPNPRRLRGLLGVPLPDLPPYSASGALSFEDGRWELSGLNGRIGDSDLKGRLSLDPGRPKPRLTGALSSESLDLDDLAGIVGAAPATGAGETASARQARAAQAASEDRFILPDDPFIADASRAASAEVSYRGKSVRAADVPLSDLSVDFRLEDGRLALSPVSFGVGDGHVRLSFDLDAAAQPPRGTLQVEVQRVDLQRALRDWNLADDSVGIVGAQGKFWVAGDSVAELLASADGGMVLLMGDGRLDALLVELAGLDAGQALLSWLRDRDAVPIECVYGDVQVRDGIAELDTMVIDSDDTLFTAGGELDFNDERLDVTILAHPKDPSVLVGRSPLHLGGTFDAPATSIHGSGIAMRSAASAVLAAVATPAAALLPLMELGDTRGSGYCGGLVERAEQAIQARSGSRE